MKKINATDRYLAENEYVSKLPRVTFSPGVLRKSHPDSMLWLINKKFRSLIALYGYFVELLNGRQWLKITWNHRASKTKSTALVIGNGPSQGFLTSTRLLEFKRLGGEIFVVNFWTENELLSSVIPDYLVISDPDTLSMNSSTTPKFLFNKNERLKKYILENHSIKIICPTSRCTQLAAVLGADRIIGFIDTEMRMWTKNINPFLPRGYQSMTLYKSLAMANWFGYNKIFVIGMDNTYPRDLFCDPENKVLVLEKHAGDDDYVDDRSYVYDSIGDSLADIALLFFDAYKFPNDKTINLDPYSLTDAFVKVRSTEWSFKDLMN